MDTAPGEDPIATKTKSASRRVNTRSAAVRPIARELAVIALDWVNQEGQLKVRQREQLRRALVAAGEELEWDTIEDNPQKVAVKELETLTKAGNRTLAKELEEELANKKTETKRLEKTTANLEKLAEKEEISAPVEVTYAYTAREGDGLVTRLEIVTVNEVQDAIDALKPINKKAARWEKLRVQMLDELKIRKRRIADMDGSIGGFTQASSGLVGEVFQIL